MTHATPGSSLATSSSRRRSVGDDEVEKLLRHGEGWLGSHPERDAITRRYLAMVRGHEPHLAAGCSIRRMPELVEVAE